METHQHPLVSVVMPFYNVGDYIENCVRSVFLQDYPHIELIAVDDCGADNSRAIVERLQKESPGNVSVRIISREQNGGLSAARNLGTSKAVGKYVYYLDSDDSIAPSCISLLVKKAEETDAELVVGGYRSVGMDINLGGTLNTGGTQVIAGNENILTAYCQRQFYMMAWNKLVRLGFLREHKLYFIEGIIHEDNPWSMQMAFCLNKVAFVTDQTYFYNIHPNSISTDVKLERRRMSWAKGLSIYFEQIERHPLYRNNYAVYDFFTSEVLCYYYFVARNFSGQILRKELQRIGEFSYPSRFSSVFSPRLPITHRIFNLMQAMPLSIRIVLIKMLSRRDR